MPVPSGATTGCVLVTVGSVASNCPIFTVTGGSPNIGSISPTSGPVGSAIAITGTNFGATQGTSTVKLNGTTIQIVSWSATSIIAQVPNGATSGNVVVTAGGVASNGVAYTVLPVPGVTNLSPALGPVGTVVTIAGTNFGTTQGTSTVTFNGTPATPTSWSATSIVVPVPTGSTTGCVIVTVSGVASNCFTFTVSAAPSITGLSPTSGAIGTSVIITGTNFGATQGTSTVKFNGTLTTPTSWSISQIIAPAPNGATTGNVVVTVSGAASNGVTFTVTTPAPSITNLSVTSGSVGTSVTITGTNFGSTQGTSIVTFNGILALPTSWGATSIATTVPNGATTGPVVVKVAGLASSGVTFTVVPAPSITSLSPNLGAVGTTVTITGANFGSTQGVSTVKFNGTSASPTTWTATSIVTPVPTGATSGAVVVTVGGVASNGVGFTVTSVPHISSVSPTSGPVGTPVTISGVNFGSSQGTSTVTFNGIPATPSSWSNTQIVAPVPNGGTSGNVIVTVNNKPSNGAAFAVSGSGPSIIQMFPSSGYVGTSVDIYGTGFGNTEGTSNVYFNGAMAQVISWSDTLIIAVVPGNATSGPVTVVLANGKVSNKNFVFDVQTYTGIPGANAVTSIGFGFDVYGAQSISIMETGWNYSPFYDVGTYIGGICLGNGAYGNISGGWVAAVTNMGWGVLPLYTGFQPNSTKGACGVTYNGNGTPEGTSDATNAVQHAAYYGMGQTVIYADIEQYTGPDQTVQNYIGAWVSTLHQKGYLAGVYFSGSNWPDVNALLNGGNAPDAIWVAGWYGSPYTPAGETYLGGFPLYGLGSNTWNVPDTVYTYARVHQFFHDIPTNPSADQFDDSSAYDVCTKVYGQNPCNPYAVFNGTTLNGTNGIDWDAEVAPVVPWTLSNPNRTIQAPLVDFPVGDEYGPDSPIDLGWEEVNAQTFWGNDDNYEVVVTDEFGNIWIDDFSSDNGYGIEPGLLDPGVTYFWTVRVNGAYKYGDWSSGGSFVIDVCDPFFGCGGGGPG